ncbi:pseudouridine synthase deg1 [Coemansia sp. RSA 1813]|nr:pseudouridine synthase deg1 [Coemansia sp. RSA 1646]KAJ1770508.1 pseudouridine synthase deg1 [Coemansia sp. RSA 1843]KAJ2092955.1 pseudouridine synthase deg1 [Coemansia sp. RSA 986]KAJ2570552.1 pseudouridine synthase deg1 [Coemansia sp. RSA 1813]
MDTEYKDWSKEALIKRLQFLEKRVEGASITKEKPEAELDQVKATKNTETAPDNKTPTRKSQKQTKRERQFDFSKFSERKVAFKFSYFGWPYHGLARQGNALGSDEKREIEDQYPTVEGELFKALANCKLITSESECDYSRCGRTDRGVSGFGQVVALYVRSTGKFVSEEEAAEIEINGSGDIVREERNGNRPVLLPPIESELPYVNMLNKCLPPEIRILAWAPVRADFSARFSCKSRFYRYFFSGDGLNIEVMRDAASKYVGTHDFRNFCRLDPAKQIANFERTVLDIAINPVPSRVSFVGDGQSAESKWWQLELRGTAFLWHQVRCMMAILFLVGQGLEQPNVVDRMVDVQNMVGKPEYEMAADTPLVLADCAFDKADVDWIYVRSPGQDVANMATLDRAVLRQWCQLNTQAIIAGALLQNLRNTAIPIPESLRNVEGEDRLPEQDQWANCREPYAQIEKKGVNQIIVGGGAIKNLRNYVPILERKRADPVELRNQTWFERKGSSKRTKLTHNNTENE